MTLEGIDPAVGDRRTPEHDLLLAELDILRGIVRGDDARDAAAELDRLRGADSAPGLDAVQRAFGLTDFERSVLLLAAGCELATATATDLLERTGSGQVTFSAALALLPGAHWSAVSPRGPLRQWRLLVIEDPTRLTASRISADESIVHAIVGLGLHDPVVDEVTVALDARDAGCDARRRVVARVGGAWTFGPVRLCGGALDDAREIVGAAAGDVPVRELIVGRLPLDPREAASTLRHCARAAVLGSTALLVPLEHVAADTAAEVVAAFAGVPFVVTHEGPAVGASLDIEPIPFAERAAALQAAFVRFGADDRAAVDAVSGAFALRGGELDEVAFAAGSGDDPWEAARRLSRAAGSLSRRFTPRADWDDLVLPEQTLSQLRALVATVTHRRVVREEWGFGDRLRRGLGTSAVFCGVSGTGKTFAAEVLASALRFDVMQVDLSQVMSKYIGETEKQLAAVFDDAERGGAVLLFDEADAVFGKRTEVKDSHDRYANLEVSYLLERLERFTGLAILTTNARSSIDAAFTRRLTAIVTFPYPDAAARRQIWARVLPPSMPRGDLDLDAVARADVSGGSIAAAALAAASLAVEEGSPVCTRHLQQALEWEMAKTGRSAGRAG